MATCYELNGRRLVGRVPSTQLVAEQELLALLLTGMTLREACEHMHGSYGKIRKIAKDPRFLLQLREKSADIAKRMVEELTTSQIALAEKLEEASYLALEEMMAMAEEMPQGAVKYKVCQDLMDRDPRLSRTKRVEASNTHEFINPELLAHAATRAREISRIGVIDVGPGSVDGDDAATSGHPNGS